MLECWDKNKCWNVVDPDFGRTGKYQGVGARGQGETADDREREDKYEKCV
ncbi:conserved domain protein [delta proteobacterium NaphS2]|nr:conserved domain protein [delta proteobacterium NaphS2]